MKEREQYTLFHIPEEHRLRAYKEIERAYLVELNSLHMNTLQKSFKKGFLDKSIYSES